MSRKLSEKSGSRQYMIIAVAMLSVVFIAEIVIFVLLSSSEASKSPMAVDADIIEPITMAVTETTTEPVETTTTAAESAGISVVYPKKTETTRTLGDDYSEKNILLMDASTSDIIASKNEEEKMYPASMTKVMTLIVTVEHIKSLEDKVEITADMIDPMIELDASRAGFMAGETPTIEQVLYGIILPSGADACLAACSYVAGSEAAFVELMNQKAQEIGCKNTHFVNSSGLYDENHYSTASDMAVILSYAMRSDLCRTVLSTETYNLPATEQNPDGISLTSTLFSRMYGDEMPNVVVKGGKTGYTDEAMHCVMTFAQANGKEYVLVIAGCPTKSASTYDTLSLYSVLCAGGEPYDPEKNERRGT